MDFLNDIGDDKVRIVYASGTTATMDVNINMKTTRDYNTVFDIDDPYNWKQSDDLLDTISDARDA